jgi:nitrogen-specific signal transduction histidine kinase
MLTRMIGEDIDLVMVPGASLGAVRADPGQIDQVIMNLAVNARDAMPQGGKLTIETANVSLDEVFARSHAPLVPGEYVMLSISDTGTAWTAKLNPGSLSPSSPRRERRAPVLVFPPFTASSSRAGPTSL